ncbi:MAG: lipopolysaccharide biosynthesis protein [Methylococcales bacterium]
MTLKKNIFANYIGTGAVALAQILALPWYLAALGSGQFGLISFVVMLQAVLGLLDAGMSQALIREVTVRLGSPEQRGAAELLFSFERIYWLFALSAGLVTMLFANMIVHGWLNLSGLSEELGLQAIVGAAAIFAVQFPGSIYRSFLVGAQAQLALNGILLVCALPRHLGGVLVLLIWPTLATYLVWQGLIALLETLLRARFAWGTLGVGRRCVGWNSESLRPAWVMLVSMSGATWLGALTVQMDRIVLSCMVSIEQFGYYTIAASAAAGVLQFIYPLVQAVLPRAVQLRGDAVALRALSMKLVWSIGLVVLLGVLVYWFGGEWILTLWLKNSQAVSVVYPLLSVLLLGTAFNAFYNVGYINWLAHERIGRVLQVNAASLLLAFLLIPPLVLWQGTIGAAFGWLTINLIGFALSLEWLKR